MHIWASPLSLLFQSSCENKAKAKSNNSPHLAPPSSRQHSSFDTNPCHWTQTRPKVHSNKQCQSQQKCQCATPMYACMHVCACSNKTTIVEGQNQIAVGPMHILMVPTSSHTLTHTLPHTCTHAPSKPKVLDAICTSAFDIPLSVSPEPFGNSNTSRRRTRSRRTVTSATVSCASASMRFSTSACAVAVSRALRAWNGKQQKQKEGIFAMHKCKLNKCTMNKCEMRNAECKNAKCRMQNTECKNAQCKRQKAECKRQNAKCENAQLQNCKSPKCTMQKMQNCEMQKAKKSKNPHTHIILAGYHQNPQARTVFVSILRLEETQYAHWS